MNYRYRINNFYWITIEAPDIVLAYRRMLFQTLTLHVKVKSVELKKVF